MSDKKDAKIINLAEHSEKLLQEAHERGELFQFHEMEEPVEEVGGLVGCQDGYVVFVYDSDEKKGLLMDMAQAKILALELIGAATYIELEARGIIVDDDEDEEDEST